MPQPFVQFGYSPIADQTVAGAFLLIPGIGELIVMSPLFFRWLGQIEQREKLADQQRQEEEEAEAEQLALEMDDVGETVSEPSEA